MKEYGILRIISMLSGEKVFLLSFFISRGKSDTLTREAMDEHRDFDLRRKLRSEELILEKLLSLKN